LPAEVRDKSFPECQAWLRPETPDGKPLNPDEMPVACALRGETVHGMLAVLHPAGKTVWTMISAGPIRSPGGRQLGAVATYSDITPLHQAQEDRDLYIHTISHDLRTPLTVIQGHSQMLEEELAARELPEQMETHLEAILTGTDRMNAMIEDMVDAARIEGGELRLGKKETSLPPLLGEFLRRLAAGLGTDRLRSEIPSDLAPVMVDTDRLERILSNLLLNALKYGPHDTPVHLGAAAGNGEVILSVADQGPGIDPEDRPHIFERFYKPKAGRRGGGIGLGLHIARMLVEAHGGRIWVESTPGEGSTFYFTLPTVH
jgi:signal transduction histidine kinase